MKKRHLASFLCVQIMPVRDVYCQTLQKRSSCHFLARAQKRVDLISRFMMGNSVKHNNNKGSEKSRNCFLNTIFRRVNLGLSRCTMSLPSRHLFFVGFKKKGFFFHIVCHFFQRKKNPDFIVLCLCLLLSKFQIF